MRLSLLCVATLAILPVLTLPFGPATSMSMGSVTAAPLTAISGESPEADAPLVGTYDCQGVEPDGTPYRGIVRIIPNQGLYDVIWTFSSGQQYSGLGVVNGDVLAVIYFTNRPGVVAYKVEQHDRGQRLQGHWTMVGAGRVFQETLTRMTREVERPEPPAQPELRRHIPMLRHLRPA